jgi:hypothetical protein
MKEHVKQVIYDYFKTIGNHGGKSVQAENMLVPLVKSNLHHELKGWYDDAVQDLVDENFLIYQQAIPAEPGVHLGRLAGYVITAYGVSQLTSY